MRAVSNVLAETLLCFLVKVLLTTQQQSVSNLVGIPLAVQEIINPDHFHTMEESQLAKIQAKTQCPFCEASFRSVGKHLKHCKKRDGRPYDMFLSCNTTRRPSKPKASTQIEQQCPKCSKKFQRLDLHLRRSATCSPTAQTGKMNSAQQSQQQQHSGPAEDTQSQSHTTPPFNTFQLPDLPGFTPPVHNYKKTHQNATSQGQADMARAEHPDCKGNNPYSLCSKKR